MSFEGIFVKNVKNIKKTSFFRFFDRNFTRINVLIIFLILTLNFAILEKKKNTSTPEPIALAEAISTTRLRPPYYIGQKFLKI